jgi:hypothetical protein
MEKCFGCGGEFPKVDESQVGMYHDYIGAMPACWQLYTEILGKEFSDPEYFKMHRITLMLIALNILEIRTTDELVNLQMFIFSLSI